MISFKFKIFGILFALFVHPLAFSRNRISETPEINNALRCNQKGLSAASCSKAQTKALSSGCINKEEYDTLIAQNAAPVCLEDDSGDMNLQGWCPCGCFDPNTRLFTENKNLGESDWMSIKDIIQNQESKQLWSLTDDASLLDWKLAPREIRKSTHGPEHKPLVYLHTTDGNILGITEEHAALLWSGEMVAAKNLTIGNKLVSSKGTPSEIKHIERRFINEEVLNVLTNGKTSASHVILAEGLAVGDLAWQNSLQSELNSILIREK